MPTNFSPWERFKSRRSKRAGNPEEPNGQHPPDVATTPPVPSGPPLGDVEASIAPKLSRPQNLSVAASVDEEEDSSKAASSNPSNPPVIIDSQETPTSPDAGAKKPWLPASAVQETLKTSSSHVAQAPVPPSVLPIIDAQTGSARTDPGVNEPQLATELAVQQIHDISTSQRLWNDAFESLDSDNNTSGLVKAYVKTLTIVLKAEKASDIAVSGTSDVSTELKDPTKRQMYMKKLVKDGQAKISAALKMTAAVGDVAKFILSAKGMVDLAIQNIPQAALPWAGVCIGLQVSSCPLYFSCLGSVLTNTPSRSS
jgi:hypothetical protein